LSDRWLNRELEFLLGDFWVSGMPRMLPPETLPSCRFLSHRVLSWQRFDAHWLRQAYRCFNTHEAITTTTGYLDDS
jgi:hypothetical protein